MDKVKIKETLKALSPNIELHQYLYAVCIAANVVSGVIHFTVSEWSAGLTCFVLAIFIGAYWSAENLITRLRRVNKSLFDLNDDLITLNKELVAALSESESRTPIQHFNSFHYGPDGK